MSAATDDVTPVIASVPESTRPPVGETARAPVAVPARRVPLRIRRVVPPRPHLAAGTYDVRLELSRPLTEHEQRVLPRVARGIQSTEGVLTIADTTLERVARSAASLSRAVMRLEDEGRRVEVEARERQRVLGLPTGAEQRRLASLAQSITFPVWRDDTLAPGTPTHPTQVVEAVAALERRILQEHLGAGTRHADDLVAEVPGGSAPPD